jgi:protease IV
MPPRLIRRVATTTRKVVGRTFALIGVGTVATGILVRRARQRQLEEEELDRDDVSRTYSYSTGVQFRRRKAVPKACVIRVDLPKAPLPELSSGAGSGFPDLSFKDLLDSNKRSKKRKGTSAHSDEWDPARGHVDTLLALRRARQDPRVAGAVFVAPREFAAGGHARMSELAEEVRKWSVATPDGSSSKKGIWFWSPYYSRDGIVLATSNRHGGAQDASGVRVHLSKGGGVWLFSPTATKFFFKDLLESLKVDVTLLRSHVRKSAGNALTETQFTQEDREDTLRLLLSADALARERSLAGSLAASVGPALPSQAVKAGLVDDLSSLDAVFDEATRNGEIAVISLSQYAHAIAAEDRKGSASEGESALAQAWSQLQHEVSGGKDDAPSKSDAPEAPKRVALVSCEGAMMGDEIVSSVRKGLLEAARDDSVAAIVLRINSPGGDVVVIEQLAAAVQRARESKKPIIASVSDVCASGGYFVAAACDQIVAAPGSVVGSIGAFTVIPQVARGLQDHLGVSSDSIDIGAVPMPDGLRPLAPAVRKRMTEMMDSVVEDFVDHVYGTRVENKRDDARVKGVTKEDVLAQLATGQVWVAHSKWQEVRNRCFFLNSVPLT